MWSNYHQKSFLAAVNLLRVTFASQNYFNSKWVVKFQAGGSDSFIRVLLYLQTHLKNNKCYWICELQSGLRAKLAPAGYKNEENTVGYYKCHVKIYSERSLSFLTSIPQLSFCF